MTLTVHTLPFNIEEAAIWPSFKPSIIDKHGIAGSIGERGEEHAITHISNEFNSQTVLNCAQSPVLQLLGIDLIADTWSGIITFDIKAGSSSLYWDKDALSWYITISDDFFIERKKNDYIMHTGVKGDLFCYYKTSVMKAWVEENKRHKRLLIPVNYTNTARYKLFKRHWPDFIRSNL